jgi:hypothetical protein
MDYELDTSWILEEEKRFSGSNEPENLQKIRCYFIYVASDSTILKVIKEYEELVDIQSKTGIYSDRLLHIIQNKRFLEGGQRFKMTHLMKYIVDIDSQKIVKYASLHEGELREINFLKEVNILGNVIIEPSLFIFHSLASLYFFMREDDMLVKPKSILKHGILSKKPHSTKKVRIFEDNSLDTVDHSKTKKKRD